MYFKEDAWWASPYNDLDEIKKISTPIHKVIIHDTTLRDGEQTPGVVFTPEDKLEIADKLMEAGITRIEAGMPAVSEDDFEAVKKITKKYPDAEVYAFARAMRKDIDLAKEAGCKGVVIEIPIGYPKLKYQFNWTWEDVLKKSIDCILYAKEQGLKADFFPYDTTRSRESDFENLLKGLVNANAIPDSIGIVDTMGCALPQTIQYLVRKSKEILGENVCVEVHCHNDFGMAVANELAGALAGAEVLHGCVNGLGERTGNAADEELILNLNILMGLDTGYKLDKLNVLCSTVERLSGVKCALNKPFVGERNYVRESGIGVDLIVNKPLAMFATNPSYFGKHARVVLGKKSGKASVTYELNRLNLQATPDQISEILKKVKERGIEKKGLVSEKEFIEITDKILKQH